MLKVSPVPALIFFSVCLILFFVTFNIGSSFSVSNLFGWEQIIWEKTSSSSEGRRIQKQGDDNPIDFEVSWNNLEGLVISGIITEKVSERYGRQYIEVASLINDSDPKKFILFFDENLDKVTTLKVTDGMIGSEKQWLGLTVGELRGLLVVGSQIIVHVDIAESVWLNDRDELQQFEYQPISRIILGQFK